MAKITRALQKLFGSNAAASEVTQFGSYAAGSPVETADPATIQALANFLDGWASAVLGDNSPALEDMNALHLLFARQLAYIFQAGVSEWEVGTTYYTGSMVNVSGDIYISLTDDNIGNATTDATNWAPFAGNSRFPAVEAITELARAVAETPASTLQDYISEAFNLTATGRMLLTNTEVSTEAQQLTLSGSNLSGSAELELYLQNAKANKAIEWSARFQTPAMFDVDSGVLTTQTILTSTSDRKAEVWTSGTAYGWFLKQVRSSTDYAFQTVNAYRVSVTNATGATDITVTHSALPVTIPAPTTTERWIFVHEPVIAQRKIAAGSYADITPSKIIQLPGLSGLEFPSYLHSFWKLGESSGGEPNYAPSGSGFDLAQLGTVPSAAGKVSGIGSRGTFSSVNFLEVSLANSTTTPYDSAVFAMGFWMKTSASGLFNHISGKNVGGTGYQFRVSNTNFISANFDGGSDLISSGISVTDDDWHLVFLANMATSGAGNFRIYVDNTLVLTTTGQAYTPAAADFTVGATPGGGVDAFDGLLTLVEWWDSMPGTWTEFESIINQRWNGGAGTDYGANVFSLYGSLPGQSASAGDRLGIKANMRREVDTINPAVQALSVSF